VALEDSFLKTSSAFEESASPTISTTSFSRIRGFTIELLFHFRNRELRAMDLIDLTGKYAQYINSYLYNMRNYGLVKKRGPYWKLTDMGLSFLSYFMSLDTYHIHTKKELRKKKERSKKELRKLREKTLKQISINPWLRNSSLDDVEKEVAEVLVEHYNRTSSKFILVKDFYELAERLKKNPHNVLEALKNLRQDNIIYLYHSKLQGFWKIGLKKAFVQMLEATQR